MQLSAKKIFVCAATFIGIHAGAQTTQLLPGMQDEWLLNRMEIKHRAPNMRFSAMRPYNRREAVMDLQHIDSSASRLSATDRFNIERFLMSNSEWSTPRPAFRSRKTVLKHFYKNPANAAEIKGEDFHLIFNPVIQYQQMRESNNNENIFLNSRGVHVRGLIENRIGFSFYMTENQERPPSYVSRWVENNRAVPGMGFFKYFKNTTGYDYFDTRASVNWRVVRWMDMQLGYDRNFIGNGYRSLFLSDFSTNYLFLKVNSRFGRFHYQNIFAELVIPNQVSFDEPHPRKYYRAHYLNYAASNWLTLGLFEGTMLGRDQRLPLELFNPVMFVKTSGNNNRLADRNYLGADIKANLFRRMQLYGQFMVDRFNRSGWSNRTWDNRLGYQAGIKLIDAFGVKQLDIQLETNRVRPYTYAANDSITNYTHYNQPLAHPLGANFQDVILIVRAQPMKRLHLQAKMIGYFQGVEIIGYNMGNNIFGGFDGRLSDVRVRVGDGDRATGLFGSFLASYELRPNMFIDAAYHQRRFETLLTPQEKTIFYSIGLRWNMARREYDFF